ncbi:hypothetical protein AB0C87_25260 [Actinomadura sp. NPDC048021]|uniref:hypothetical protein n=1 Tax=Actinomadura sp. NPDC048021 TaxID=3155385 RepID=UPI00340CD1CF
MTSDEAVAALDALDGRDGEAAHAEADRVLHYFVPEEVRLAYERVIIRADFWAYA